MEVGLALDTGAEMGDRVKSIGWIGAAALSHLVSGCATLPDPSTTASITTSSATAARNARAEVPGEKRAALMPHNPAQKRAIYYKVPRPSDQRVHRTNAVVPFALPPFPTSWPPPEPTTHYPYPPLPLDRFKTFGDVAAALQSTAQTSQRHEMTFYRVPGGFAMILPRDQIDKFGLLTTEPVEKYLLQRNVYKHRLIGFFVSNQIARDHDKRLTFERAGSWMQGGSPSLDRQTAGIPLTKDHKVFAFVYIYNGPRGAEELQPADVVDLKAETHLSRANIVFPPPAKTAKRKSGNPAIEGDTPK